MKHLSLLTLILLISCTKPEEQAPSTTPIGRVFVCCEGNFMFSNASLSLYDPLAGTVQNELFYAINNFPLGDVLQSMTIQHDKAFLVINNSGKIVVMDPKTCRHTGIITGLNSPRYVEHITPRKIYISDLYSPSIAIADPSQLKVTGQIYLGRSSEQMASHQGFTYVCSWSFSDKVYKIDNQTDTVVDSLNVALQPNSMAIDKYNKLWVLSDGAYKGAPIGQQKPCITIINTLNFTVESQLEFDNINLSPSHLTTNAAKDTIYYIKGGHGSQQNNNSATDGSDANTSGNGICRLGALERQLPQQVIIPELDRLFYSLAIDPANSHIYVGDAIDYTQSGIVLRYSPGGELIDQFKVGITPGSFCFR